jgi:hypothetical protein
MFPRRLRVLVLFGIAATFVPLTSFAQEIAVKVLDCRNGMPYADRLVTFGFFGTEKNPQIPDLKAKTAANGTATFHLSEGMPAQFMVFPGTRKDLYPCSTLLPIDVHRIISEGLVSRCSKNVQGCRCKFGKAVAGIHSQPGELVIFARPITRGERVRWSIWGD